MHQYTLIGICLVIAAVSIWIAMLRAKRRSEELAAEALALGFSFSRKAPSPNFSSDLDPNRETRAMRGAYTATNVMSGVALGATFNAFDTQIRQGKSTRIRTLTTFGFALPVFHLRRRHTIDKIEWLHREVNIENHDAFSSKFIVRAPDEAAVRAIFTEEVIGALVAFSSEHPWVLESSGTALFVYHDDPTEFFSKRAFTVDEWMVKPEAMPDFVREATALAAMFQHSGLKM